MKKLISVFCLLAGQTMAQSPNILTLQQAIDLATRNNPQVNMANLRIDRERVLLPASFNPIRPDLVFEAPTGQDLRPGIQQTFSLPAVYISQRKAQEGQIRLTEAQKSVTTNGLRYQIRTIYNDLLYLREVVNNYRRQDSLLLDFARVTSVRQRVGQISRIEVLNAQSQQKEVNYLLDQTRARERSARIQLGLLAGLGTDTTLRVTGPFNKLSFSTPIAVTDTNFAQNPLSTYYQQNQQLSQELLNVEKKRRLPNLIVGYLNQGTAETGMVSRLRFGVSLPVWGWVTNARIKAAEKDVDLARSQISLNQYEMQGSYDRAISDYRQYIEAVDYYETIGLLQADEIVKAAQDGYRLGSIGYYDYLLNIQQAFKIRLGYLDALRNFNQSVITLHYLKGE